MVNLVMLDDLALKIRHLADWPTKGVSYTDTAEVFSDAALFRDVIRALVEPYAADVPDAVAGIEARGFILAAAMAYQLNCGMLMIRRRGKLAPPVFAQEYSYEYASNAIEMSDRAIQPGQRIVLVDDILATGATAAAALKLIKRLDGEVAGISCIVEKDFLSPRERLGGHFIHSLLKI